MERKRGKFLGCGDGKRREGGTARRMTGLLGEEMLSPQPQEWTLFPGEFFLLGKSLFAPVSRRGGKQRAKRSREGENKKKFRMSSLARTIPEAEAETKKKVGQESLSGTCALPLSSRLQYWEGGEANAFFAGLLSFPLPLRRCHTSSFCVFAGVTLLLREGEEKGKEPNGFLLPFFFPFRAPTDRIPPLPSPFSAWHSTSLCTERKRNKCRKTAMNYSGKASLFVAPFPCPFFLLSLRTWLIYKGNKCPHATTQPPLPPPLLSPTPHCKHPRRIFLPSNPYTPLSPVLISMQ